jgi:hypothetical protein
MPSTLISIPFSMPKSQALKRYFDVTTLAKENWVRMKHFGFNSFSKSFSRRLNWNEDSNFRRRATSTSSNCWF